MLLNRGKLPTPQATVLKKIIMVVVVVHQIINPRCQAEAEEVDLVCQPAEEARQLEQLVRIKALHRKRSLSGSYRVCSSDKLSDL